MIHGPDAAVGDLADRATAWIRDRLAGAPLGRVGDRAALHAALAGAIGPEGLGLDRAWSLFTDHVAPETIGLDSERFLAFIPMSPSVAATWMDAVVGTASFSAESWLEAAGAVAAEEQVIRLLAGEAGLPPTAAGCFMSGGSIGNLSALAVARAQAGGRRAVAVADTAHASIDNALHLLGLEPVLVRTGPDCRLTGAAMRAALAGRDDVGIVVASGGSTNAGVVDDLAGCADVAAAHDAWFHVDGAYGLAAMLLPEQRSRFTGIERADSFIVDPHKWLFSTGGSCALVYRRPDLARAVHTQHGPYIDILHGDQEADGGDALDAPAYNPCDLGYQLTRRASGLPVWFALVLHGLDAHRDAIRHSIALAGTLAGALDACPTTETVLPPELGVVLFRRHGWGRAEWRAWAERTLHDGIAFVAPTTHRGEPVGRVVFMHPRTPASIVGELVATLA